MDLLWWAIVGITDQLLLGKIKSSVYTLQIDNIHSLLSCLTNKTNDQCNLSASKMYFENDLHLVLYRHLSVLESMRFSLYVACKLKLWTLKAVSPIVSETFFVWIKFLFTESFLQNGSPIPAILFVKTVLPYSIEDDINTYSA